MNTDESKHNETSKRNGPRAVPGSQQPPTKKDIQIGPVLLSRSDALRAEDGSRSAGTAEPKNESATKRPSKRGRTVGAIIALVIVAGLALGFLPRLRQSRLTATD